MPPPAAVADPLDDLSREVYCVLGIPVDVVDMATVREKVEAATTRRRPFLISTANLNFLIRSQSDIEFRESLVMSDLCTADGMALVWLARLLGIPVRQRIAGADFLQAFREGDRHDRPLKVYVFGGAEGVAAAAAKAINTRSDNVRCVGWHYPGFGSAAELSAPEKLNAINASGADVLLASLGAEKGQSWLLHNHDRLHVPVRAHIGAALNFEAGVFKRAPLSFQKYGLEWLWRIKEEPYLWRRYWKDGWALAQLFLARVVPMMIGRWRLRLTAKSRPLQVNVTQVEGPGQVVILRIQGPATNDNAPALIDAFRRALSRKSPVLVDMSRTTHLDARFLGLLLVARKTAAERGRDLTIGGLSPHLARLFSLNRVEFPIGSAAADGRG
jgi:N-acetylglucosaminyldiphosphoundecaprenol N-acetyl-beta-D-mannosaminyltransferase